MFIGVADIIVVFLIGDPFRASTLVDELHSATILAGVNSDELRSLALLSNN